MASVRNTVLWGDWHAYSAAVGAVMEMRTRYNENLAGSTTDWETREGFREYGVN